MNSSIKKNLQVHIRWMIRADMSAILAIENESFDRPWTEREFVSHLRKRNYIGLVCEHDGFLHGYIIYQISRIQSMEDASPNKIEIVRMAVCKESRFKGVGRQLVQKVLGKWLMCCRIKFFAMVRETSLQSQLFFRNMGFRATGVLREFFYEDTNEDAYIMKYEHQNAMEAIDGET
jgi:[ribosomal protein S18]-alanine N-acetyltransferase